MAKGKETSAPPRRMVGKVLPWLLIAVILVLAWLWPTMAGYTRTGAAVGARLACSCRYVAGRSLSECRRHFESGMGPVWLSEDAEEKSVTARYLLFSSQTARYRRGQGSVLEAWDE